MGFFNTFRMASSLNVVKKLTITETKTKNSDGVLTQKKEIQFSGFGRSEFVQFNKNSHCINSFYLKYLKYFKNRDSLFKI